MPAVSPWLITEQEPGEHEDAAGGTEEREDGEVPGGPPPGPVTALAGLDAEALGPAQRVHLLEQVELEPLALELGDAPAEQRGVLALPRQHPLQDGLRVGLVPQRPEHGQRRQQRHGAGDPRPPARRRRRRRVGPGPGGVSALASVSQQPRQVRQFRQNIQSRNSVSSTVSRFSVPDRE